MTDNNSKYRLAPEFLYQTSDLERFDFKSTADLEPLSTTIGQERALEAINFSVEMHHASFNLYVMGSSGLGRHALVREALKERAENATRPADWCYVSNFQHPHSPYALQMPAGTGRTLRSDLQQLVEDLLNAIPAAFQGDEYQQRHTEIIQDIKIREDKAAQELEALASERHIVLLRGTNGFTLTPEKDGKTLSSEEFDELPEEEQQQFRKSLGEIKELLRATMDRAPEWQHEIQNRMRVA